MRSFDWPFPSHKAPSKEKDRWHLTNSLHLLTSTVESLPFTTCDGRCISHHRSHEPHYHLTRSPSISRIPRPVHAKDTLAAYVWHMDPSSCKVSSFVLILQNEAITVTIQTPIVSARLYCARYASPRRRRNTIELEREGPKIGLEDDV